MKTKTIILLAMLTGGALLVAYMMRKNAAGGGGGGGGLFDIPIDIPGIFTKATSIGQTAGAPNEYAAYNPQTTFMENYTYKGGGTPSTGVATYYAPEVIQNMRFPGPALPAPAPGIGLAPRAIIL